MSQGQRARLGRGLRTGALAVALGLAAGTSAAAAGAGPGFYTGRTSQGKAITFVVAGGHVSELYTEIVDACHPGSYHDYLTPRAAKIGRTGRWTHRADEIRTEPTVYHGRVRGSRASGTIDDVVRSRGRRCHGHVRFTAAPHAPMQIGAASVGGRGTDVELRLRMPPGSNGNELIPYTATGLLVYGSSTGCPASYAAADALARSVAANGESGLISDAFVTADYQGAPYELAPRGHAHGVFMFHVAANTVVPTPTGASPFTTLCVMLYSGRPAKASDVALATVSGPLRPGRGIPDTQP